MSESVQINVSPALAVMDDVVDITVTGLMPYSAVTVSAINVQRDVGWLGFGQFYADGRGQVNVGCDSSHGGTYTGVLKMGLFTSMQAQLTKTNGNRWVITGSAEEVASFRIQVWKGHQTRDDLQTLNSNSIVCDTDVSNPLIGSHYRDNFLAEAESRRTYMHPDVVRVPVREEMNGTKIRGVLFLPSSNGGPFPAVIDMFGGIGGCVEFRAALLAKQGYAAFALAYMGYEDLGVKSMTAIDEAYFGHAISWLLSQSCVDARRGVGMIGVCLGSYFILNQAIADSRVRAAICISPAWHMTPGLTNNIYKVSGLEALRYGMCVPGGSHRFRDGMVTYRRAAKSLIPRPILKHRHDNPILFVVGEQEQSSDSIAQTDEIMQQFKRSGKRNISRVVIPKQGHLLEPPYAPMCTATTSGKPPKKRETVAWSSTKRSHLALVNWGGDAVNHEPYQVHAWQVVLEFLRKSLAKPINESIMTAPQGSTVAPAVYSYAKL